MTAPEAGPLEERPSPLLLCGFGPFADAPKNPSGVVVEALRGDPQLPRADAVVLPTVWSEAYERLAVLAEGRRGVLLVGVDPRGRELEVEMRARNAASTTRRDAAGERWPWPRISPVGPAVARTSAPVAAMVRAAEREGLAARASSDAGDYVCNYVLYRLLTERPDLCVGFLHVPLPAEFGGGAETADLDLLVRGVRAAAIVFAGALTRSEALEPA